jgi:tetratricopeptide (TPR) repeat protein
VNEPLALEGRCVRDSRPSEVAARAEARLALGVEYAAQGRSRLAVDQLRRVDPDDSPAAAARASMRLHRLLIALGDQSDAWQSLGRAVELSNACRSPDVELELAARAGALGQHDEAVDRYRAVIAMVTVADPLGALAAFRAGELRFEQGLLDEALALWRSALPGSDEALRPHVLDRLANTLRDRAGEGEAEGFYQLLVETDHPRLSPRAALALAGLLEGRGAFPAAAQMYAMASSSGDLEVAEVADARRRALARRRVRALVRGVNAADQRHEAGSGPGLRPQGHVAGYWTSSSPPPPPEIQDWARLDPAWHGIVQAQAAGWPLFVMPAQPAGRGDRHDVVPGAEIDRGLDDEAFGGVLCGLARRVLRRLGLVGPSPLCPPIWRRVEEFVNDDRSRTEVRSPARTAGCLRCQSGIASGRADLGPIGSGPAYVPLPDRHGASGHFVAVVAGFECAEFDRDCKEPAIVFVVGHRGSADDRDVGNDRPAFPCCGGVNGAPAGGVGAQGRSWKAS